MIMGSPQAHERSGAFCFLIDSPYLSTQTLTYNGYRHLSDYINVLHPLHGTNYFYFTSAKSRLVELCEWLERESYLANPFAGVTRINQATNLNHDSHYTDIVLYRHIQFQPKTKTEQQSQPQTLLNDV